MEKAEEAKSIDYSPSATLTLFTPPPPLLRIPINSPSSDPSLPPFLLSFPTPNSFSTSYNSCQSQLFQQCEAGARIGCSISASDKCKPPFWKRVKTLLGFSKQDFAETAKCEEQEMEACLVAAREKCVGFAREKCFMGFGEARVEVEGLIPELVDWREVGRFIGWVSQDGKRATTSIGLVQAHKMVVRIKNQLRVTNCKGKDLVDSKFCSKLSI